MSEEQLRLDDFRSVGEEQSSDEIPVGYKKTEIGIIPEEWDTQLIGSIFDFKNGLNKSRHFFGEGTPIVNYMDVYRQSGIYSKKLEGRVLLTREEIRQYEVKRGDVLFTRTSETVDEVGLSAVILDDPIETVFSGFLLRARPKNASLSNQFKKYCFQSEYVRLQITSKSTYTTRALTNGRTLSSVKILRPPLNEQRAIAGALTDVDNLIESLDNLISKKQAIKKATMQQLLTGRTRLPGFEGEWELKQLGTFACVRSYRVFPASVNPETICIELEHIEQGTGRLCAYSKAAESESSKFLFFSGDILFGRLRPYLKKFWLAKQNGLCSTEIWPLNVSTSDILNNFLFYVVQTEQFLEASGVSYGTHMPRADWKVLRELLIAIPAIEEQRAITSILLDMDAEIEALERLRDKTKQVKLGMMQQLLTGRIRLLDKEAV